MNTQIVVSVLLLCVALPAVSEETAAHTLATTLSQGLRETGCKLAEAGKMVKRPSEPKRLVVQPLSESSTRISIFGPPWRMSSSRLYAPGKFIQLPLRHNFHSIARTT